jgi:hypothetical protein
MTTRLQQLDLEIAESKARLAEIQSRITKQPEPQPEIQKQPKTARKPRVKIAKSDKKLKKDILEYMSFSFVRGISWWIETDGQIHSFYEKFNDCEVSEKLAILEVAFPDNPELIQEYLDYVPE